MSVLGGPKPEDLRAYWELGVAMAAGLSLPVAEGWAPEGGRLRPGSTRWGSGELSWASPNTNRP